jgi:hypothetical protein
VRVTQWTADPSHGPLPLLLIGLTVVTGLVDAFSYLRLGHVFVANMTGNVVFLGFGLAGVGEISIVASLLAILAFAQGGSGCQTTGPGGWRSPCGIRGEPRAFESHVRRGRFVADLGGSRDRRCGTGAGDRVTRRLQVEITDHCVAMA